MDKNPSRFLSKALKTATPSFPDLSSTSKNQSSWFGGGGAVIIKSTAVTATITPITPDQTMPLQKIHFGTSIFIVMHLLSLRCSSCAA